MITKIALSAALVLSTASAALAASKHQVRHEERTARERVVTPGYYAYGYRSAPRSEEGYIGIQDKFYRDSMGQ